MSLKDLDKEDDYDEVLPKKKRGHGMSNKGLSKIKKPLIILIVGIILGILFSTYYLEPILSTATTGSGADCIASKELLTKENACLYKLLQDTTLIEQCKDTGKNVSQQDNTT
jgi:hypothetical protein